VIPPFALGFLALAAAVAALALRVDGLASVLALVALADAVIEAHDPATIAADLADAGRLLARLLRWASATLPPLPRGLTPRICSYTRRPPSATPSASEVARARARRGAPW
jgi:hypothetical protein